MPKGSAEPGPWRTSRVPYSIPIYDAFVSPLDDVVVIVMGSQMTKSEIFVNVIGHRLSDGPYVPILFVAATENAARDFARDRVAPMIDGSGILHSRLRKGQDDKVTSKNVGGVPLNFAWAGSPQELASKPNGVVLVDDRDRMLSDVGNEGDPVGIVSARLDTYVRSKLGVGSTPTIDGASPIMQLFKGGTRQIFCWSCIHCGQWFRPRSALLIYPSDGDEHDVYTKARVVCPECGAELTERDKDALNSGGRYYGHTLTDVGEWEAATVPHKSRTASFMVNGLCSPWKAFGKLAVDLWKAYAGGEQSTLQTVFNTGFGETFKVRGTAPEWDQVYSRRIPIEVGIVSEWVQLVTMGCDVQKDGVYFVIGGWGFNKRSHLIKHGFIYGDTAYDSVWVTWAQVLNQQYDGRQLVDVTFIDSGFNPKRDQFKRPDHKIYEVCRRTLHRAFPTKGRDRTEDAPLLARSIDITIGGRTIRGGVTLFLINTDYFKTAIHTWINAPEDVNQWTLHSDADDDYCRQVVAKELVVKPSGHRVWICPNHRPNHYLDREVLAFAAARARQVDALPAEPVAPAPAAVGALGDLDEELEFIEDFGDEFWSRHGGN